MNLEASASPSLSQQSRVYDKNIANFELLIGHLSTLSVSPAVYGEGLGIPHSRFHEAWGSSARHELGRPAALHAFDDL